MPVFRPLNHSYRLHLCLPGCPDPPQLQGPSHKVIFLGHPDEMEKSYPRSSPTVRGAFSPSAVTSESFSPFSYISHLPGSLLSPSLFLTETHDFVGVSMFSSLSPNTSGREVGINPLLGVIRLQRTGSPCPPPPANEKNKTHTWTPHFRWATVLNLRCLGPF